MRSRLTPEQRAALLTRYAQRVASLSPDAWGRLRVRCAELDGPEFSALIRRTMLVARSHELPIPSSVAHMPSLRVIRGVSRAVQIGFAFVGQIAAEFDAAQPTPAEPPRPRAHSTGRPTIDAFMDARFLIETALVPIERDTPGLAAAVRAGADVLYMHDFLPDAHVDAVYAFMESEIPFAELEHPAY